MASRQQASAKLEALEVRNIRNIEALGLDPSPGTNVICGANGQGKTSLLEAIYLVATTRSFRTHRLRETIRHGTDGGSAKARFEDMLGDREQVVGLTPTQRSVRVDGQRPASLAQYAVKTPVVVFHPGELALTMGPASGRRTLLNRIALFFDPTTHAVQHAYGEAMRARQRLLQVQGPQAQGLEAYERLMVEHGMRITRFRQDVAEKLANVARGVLDQATFGSLRLDARYVPGGSLDEQEECKRLVASRSQDCRRSSSTHGPHRDEFLLEINGASTRTDASQGQHRLLTLCLKIAEMVCVGQARGVNPILLLDDVSSELDAERTEAFFDLLGHRNEQVFLTTTRAEMLSVFERKMGETNVFWMKGGQIGGKPW